MSDVFVLLMWLEETEILYVWSLCEEQRKSTTFNLPLYTGLAYQDSPT